MNKDEPTTLFECPSAEIGAYLDAELTLGRALELEVHFTECETCRSELNSQKHFLLALNRSLETSNSIELPKNFAKTIAAKAESSVIGLRSRSERIAAFAISILLLLFALVAFGGGDARLYYVDRVVSVFDVVGHLAYSVAFGAVSLLKNAVFGFANQTPAAFWIGSGLAVVLLVAIFVRFFRPHRNIG